MSSPDLDRRRERRAAEDRNVPGGDDAGIDRVGARCQRQHEEVDRALKAAARGFIEAVRPEDQLAVMMFADGIVVSHDFAKNRQEALDAMDEYGALAVPRSTTP